MKNDFNKKLELMEKQLRAFVLDNKQANELYETIEKLKKRIAQRNRIEDWETEEKKED